MAKKVNCNHDHGALQTSVKTDRLPSAKMQSCGRALKLWNWVLSLGGVCCNFKRSQVKDYWYCPLLQFKMLIYYQQAEVEMLYQV